jgi:chorismate mutase/prephenate dehydratase
MSDPAVDRIREQISSVDRALLAAVNKRLELVRELWQHKERHGLPLVDSSREEALLRNLAEANGGPLSAEGLSELFTHLLDLTKRETARAAEVRA